MGGPPLPGQGYVEVAVGAMGVCALDGANRLSCAGQLGAVSAPRSLKRVTVGSRFACGVTELGRIECWGYEGEKPYQQPLLDTSYVDVAATRDKVCAIRASGSIDCWGQGGALPELSPTESIVRDIVSGPYGICVLRRGSGRVGCVPDLPGMGSDALKSVTMGDRFRCGLRMDDTISCWGPNVPAATVVPQGAHRQVTAGRAHVCALDLAGKVVCWGPSGQTASPPGTFTSISAALDHTCGLAADESVHCWGDDAIWAGHPPPPGRFGEIAAGPSWNCAVGVDDRIECWGPGKPGGATVPKQRVRQLSIGDGLACGLDPIDGVVCWGAVPWEFSPIGAFRVFRLGPTSCGVRHSGQLFCFGATTINADGWSYGQ
jgi:hypothetical protein